MSVLSKSKKIVMARFYHEPARLAKKNILIKLNSMRATRALINLKNLEENILQIKKFISGKTKICVAVKADAYGHGAVRCALTAEKCGADFLSVATVDEGAELRKAGITLPILMLSLCAPDEICDAVKFSITPLVFDEEYIDGFNEACKKNGVQKFAVHLAVDTGMGRIGCFPCDAGKIAEKIRDSSNLFLEGCATHFAFSDGISDHAQDYTGVQFDRFREAIQNIKDAGVNPGICHCANSASTLNNPEMHLDMVRPGIIVYGFGAGEVDEKFLSEKGYSLSLKPVMTMESRICAIRKIKKGETVSYGCTWKAEKDTFLGVVPAGYADGIFRRFSECGVKVFSGGKSYGICGRICMDQLMIDLGTDCTASRWDTVVFFGENSDGKSQTASDIAELTGTIPYEITCGISRRVERIFIG
jgi:alanine racemase